MTTLHAPLPSAHDRRRRASAFRGSLERRLPQASLATATAFHLPPDCRSEAFAEDLSDDVEGSARATAAARPAAMRRWLGLPVLALTVGATLGLAGLTRF
jgi:hypothetical protein